MQVTKFIISLVFFRANMIMWSRGERKTGLRIVIKGKQLILIEEYPDCQEKWKILQ